MLVKEVAMLNVTASPTTANGFVTRLVLLLGAKFSSPCTMDLKTSIRGIPVVLEATWINKPPGLSSRSEELINMVSVPSIADAGAGVSDGETPFWFAPVSAPIRYGTKNFTVPTWTCE